MIAVFDAKMFNASL